MRFSKMQFNLRGNHYFNLWMVFLLAFSWYMPPAFAVYAKDVSTPYALAGFCDTQSEIPFAECTALEDFYQATGGENWIDHSGWLETLTPCSWLGVRCQAGHVVAILFDQGNNLAGNLPASIGNLSYLQGLKLDGNQLDGPIPAEIGNLTEMVAVDLSHNLLDGAIPVEMWDLYKLQHLDLGHNGLTGELSPAIGNLTALTFLNLSENQLSGSIPPSYSNLSQIMGVFLFSNHFSGTIPPELANLTRVYEIYLYDNQLNGQIPAELGQMPALQTLDLSYNALSGEFPAALANTPVPLGFLKIDGNLLEATNPDTRAFLDQIDPGWSMSQTWSPADFQIGSVSTQTATLVWTPVEFRQSNGGYGIEIAPQAGGPFQQITETTSKEESSFQVSGLQPDTSYFFRMRTHTAPYDGQQNDLWSAYTPLVKARTLAPVIADFAASERFGVTPMQATFENRSSGNPYQALWEFGDGITSTLNSPQHIYDAAGVYTVTLTVTGNGGVDSLMHPAFIQVYEGLEMSLPASEPINLTYLSGGITVTLYSAPQWVNGPLKVMFLPEKSPVSLPPGYRSLDIGFRLAAVMANQFLEYYSFPQPFIIHFGGLSNQGGLSLMEFREHTWLEERCSGADSLLGMQDFQLCHTGYYALFEKEPSPALQEAPVYLPLIQR